ncbi:hypothetical protein DMENIID0001_021620 [Sergentomyia squamirostris]
MASEELIGEIQKISEILKSPDTNWDVIEITQLLKSLGLQLESLDFDVTGNVEPSSHLSVEIRCGSSKITSKLRNSHPRVCLCPSNGANNSFWEVQGSAPSVSGGNANSNEKSSNLLPDVPKIVDDSVKSLMSVALELFKTAHTINELNIPGKIKKEPEVNGEAEKLNVSVASEATSTPAKDDVFLASIRADNDRDIKIIQQLSEARYKMDQALLMLKFNGRLDGTQNSLLMVTPQKPNACSSPKINLLGLDSLSNRSHKVENKNLSRGKTLTLPPRGDHITQKRRSVGTMGDIGPLKKPSVIHVPALPASGNKKKLAVKENITSNLRKTLTLSQSMPKLPTSSKK